MSSDYSFMKTGHNLVEDDTEDLKKDIVAYITLFLENALRSATVYAIKHGKRDSITVEDIKRCMMLEVFLFIKRPGVDQKLGEVKDKLFNEEDEDEEDPEILDDEDGDEFKESDCSCGLCKCITEIYPRWESWTPSSKMEEIFQKHINNM